MDAWPFFRSLSSTEFLISSPGCVAEVGYADGVLTLQGPRGTLVVNKHYLTQQIWYSSPFVGPQSTRSAPALLRGDAICVTSKE